MKKLTAILVATSLALTACGGSDEPQAEENTAVETAVAETKFEPTAQELEAWVKDVVGMPEETSFSTALTDSAYPTWVGAVQDLEWKASNLWVITQLDHDLDEQTAEQAAGLLANSAAFKKGKGTDEISDNMNYVIVADGTGRQIAQAKVN